MLIQFLSICQVGGQVIISHFAQEVYHVDICSMLDINFHFVCILSMSMVKFTAIEGLLVCNIFSYIVFIIKNIHPNFLAAPYGKANLFPIYVKKKPNKLIDKNTTKKIIQNSRFFISQFFL